MIIYRKSWKCNYASVKTVFDRVPMLGLTMPVRVSPYGMSSCLAISTRYARPSNFGTDRWRKVLSIYSPEKKPTRERRSLSPAHTFRIYANISGTGKLQFPVNTGANPPSKQDDYLYGDLSSFTGVIEAGATGSGTKPILAFATAKSFPGDMAVKTEQGLSAANGVKLAFSASGSIGPNRGVFFGTGTQTVVDVAAGETVVISSDISGTSGFEKTGTGTLALTGNLKGLSGTVKVSEGTLSLPSESRCRTFTLDVAEGATVTYAPPSGMILFVR